VPSSAFLSASGDRQLQAPPDAIEHGGPDRLLECLNLLRDGGPGHVQCLRCPHHGTTIGHGLQDLELPQRDMPGIHK
jgi:hypothetical protein